jgi:hypothetical protein
MQKRGEAERLQGRIVSERYLQPKQWVYDPDDDDPSPPGATGPPLHRLSLKGKSGVTTIGVTEQARAYVILLDACVADKEHGK